MRPCAVFAQNDADAGWLSHLCQTADYRVPLDFALLGTDWFPELL